MPLEKQYLQLMKALVPKVADDYILERFSALYDRIIDTNEHLNITSLTSPIDVTLKHFADSLSLLNIPQFEKGMIEGKSLCDIGCGGGFPGLPIACVFPENSISMIDSTEKKIKALHENAKALGLANVIPVAGRGEELSKPKGSHREKYDFCVSRAVAALPTLCELCLPFVRVEGLFIALKGQKAMEELDQSKRAITALGAVIETVYEWKPEIPNDALSGMNDDEEQKIREFLSASRYLIVLKKKKNTPETYPRKWAQIVKKSL